MTDDRKPDELELAGLHVRIWPGTGPCVVALPGLGSSGGAWQDLARRLPEAHIVAPDLRGRGRSPSGTGPSGLAGHARDVATLVDKLDISDIVLVGHSMGAYLSPVVAGELGDRVERLVWVDGGLRPAFPFFMGPTVTRMLFSRQLKRMDRDWADVRTFAQRHIDASLRRRPELVEPVVEMLAAELGGEPGKLRPTLDTGRAIADAVDTFYGPSVVPALEALKVPAHAVLAAHSRGDTDKPFIADKVVAEWSAKLPDFTWERLDENHLTVLFTDAVARAVAGR